MKPPMELPTSSATDRPTALLIEDDDVIRECVAGWLTDEGWAVQALPSAEDGLSAAKSSRPQLAVLDVKLAGLHDGMWLASQLQASVPTTRVFFATGIDDLPGAATLRANVAGYLVKPYSRRDLHHALATLPFAPSANRSAAEWPPAVLEELKVRRQTLLANIRTVLAQANGGEERLVAALLPEEDPKQLSDLCRLSSEIARRLNVDPLLMPDIERAVCFSHVGRQVLPTPADVPQLSSRDALQLIEAGYLEESRWALFAMGMPVAGEIVARLSLGVDGPPHRGAHSPMDAAVRVAKGVLVWKNALALATSRGYEARQAANDAMMRVRDPHTGVDAKVADAIEAICLDGDGPSRS